MTLLLVAGSDNFIANLLDQDFKAALIAAITMLVLDFLLGNGQGYRDGMVIKLCEPGWRATTDALTKLF